MAIEGSVGLFVGAVVIGLIHGAEPGHGWPIAATYALDRPRPWASGLLASTLLGLGHLVSSIAVVAVFFLAKSYFDITQVGWVRYVAGVLLIGLGIREYLRGGHSHGDASPREGHDHDVSKVPDHSHDGGHDHGGAHSHAHENHDHHTHETNGGLWARLRSFVPFVGGGHSHDHGAHFEDADSTDLASLVTTAFVLGFVHEEEFEIIGLCLGSDQCLALMLAYALAVMVGLVGLTMLLLAGYSKYEERVERYAEYFPAFSAAVLILMGIGFIVGVF